MSGLSYTTICEWSEIKKSVAQVNPKLATIIDKINPKESHRLYKMRFPFGETILDKGRFFLPNQEGKIVPLTDSSIPKMWLDDLSYNKGTNPISVVLDKSAEIYLPVNAHTIPNNELFKKLLFTY